MILTSLPHAPSLASRIGLVAAGVSMLLACSETVVSPIAGSGGATASVGGNGSGRGGNASVGGTTGNPTQTGGKVGIGGSPSGGVGQGGTTSASGGSASGGTTATTGGSSSRGGASAGGTVNAGGTTATGGASAIGGKATSGGASSGGNTSGGNTTTGGTTTLVGGAGSATGGNASVGGASTAGAPSVGGSTGSHWVGTWSASPYVDTNSNNTPPISLSNSVVRQVTHVSLGGSQIRVQFSNLFGNGPVTINSAHIALCKATPAVDSTIDTATDKALAFSGTASVTIAQGKEVWSDPIDFTVPNQGNITITTAFGSVPSTLTQHSGSRTTSYFQSGSTNVSAANMTSAQTKELWFFISGIDVMADASAKCAVAIGDSITDGRGTDNNKNNRWTDILAARLQANAATANVGMLNQGIGATNLVGTSGTAGQARFARDVLGQSGVKYAIVYHGVNDIGSSGTSFAALKTAYDDLISRAHAKGLLIYGGTILPFGANSYYSAAHESVRQQVNTYIKSGAFDGYIDFDAALTDGGNPPNLQTVYATWAQTDGLHPGPAGYQKMGETPALTLFTK